MVTKFSARIGHSDESETQIYYNYNADKEGTNIVYESVAKAVCNVRACAPLSADWSDDINEDYIRRGKKNR